MFTNAKFALRCSVLLHPFKITGCAQNQDYFSKKIIDKFLCRPKNYVFPQLFRFCLTAVLNILLHSHSHSHSHSPLHSFPLSDCTFSPQHKIHSCFGTESTRCVCNFLSLNPDVSSHYKRDLFCVSSHNFFFLSVSATSKGVLFCNIKATYMFLSYTQDHNDIRSRVQKFPA